MCDSNSQLHDVFVYGSFQEPEVINVILDRTPQIVSATLPGFQRYRLKGRSHPCVVPSENGEVHGKVGGSNSGALRICKVTTPWKEAELENVDWVEFQGNEYERVTVEVIRKDNLEKMTVETYLWINKNDPDIGGEWDFEEWKRLNMKNFIVLFKEWMDEKNNPQGKEDQSNESPSS